MSIWAELKRVVNDNFSYPLNKQNFYPTNFGTNAEWFEASTTYTVPQTGVYIVTCVGKGGNAHPQYEQSYSSQTGGWKTPGGGGAVCKGYFHLYAGQVIYITIDASQSNFGNLIAAGAGQNGNYNYDSQTANAAGGAVLIAGNIMNNAGFPGVAGENAWGNGTPNDGASLLGGNAGIITPWSLNGGWSQGYLPFVNWTELTGGAGGDGDTILTGSIGKFGGGLGANSPYPDVKGARGGGGYGAGGNWTGKQSSSTHTGQYSTASGGGKGVIIVEHGTMIYG